MKLDHFVIHVENAEIFDRLKKEINPLGFPFAPEKGSSAHGLKTANICIGKQYLQVACLLQPRVSGWNPRWVESYNHGKRGVFSIYIAVGELDVLHKELLQRGLEIPAPESRQTLARASKDILETVTDFLGLGQSKSKKFSPRRCLNLPPIPGTDMDISFLEYREDTEEERKTLLKPNSEEYGITGIQRIKIYLPLWEEGIEFLQKIFPKLLDTTTQQKAELRTSTLLFFRSDPEDGLKLKLEAKAENKPYAGHKFQIENVEIKTVP